MNGHFLMRKWVTWLSAWLLLIFVGAAAAEPVYLLGPGDVLRISVYNNPDLATLARISEAGAINFPLLGEVKLAGGSVAEAERKIAGLLDSGGFVKRPQVNVLVEQFQSKVVSVLGSVLKPGRYPLDRPSTLADVLAMSGGVTADGSDLMTVIHQGGKSEFDLKQVVDKAEGVHNMLLSGGEIVYVHARDVTVMGQVNHPGKYAVVGGVRTVADFLSMAGGINAAGSDMVTVTTLREGKVQRFEIDVDSLFRGDATNIELHRGDTLYVPRAPVFYIYGEVQHPGSYRIERRMTVIQALAQGGGPTVRGTQRNLQLHRRNAQGQVEKLTPALTDAVLPDDVLYVQESLF